MNCRELFINTDDVLIIRKELACIIGLNEAIVLNQIEYWLEKYSNDNSHYKDGCVWVYNSYEDWNNNNFPFWSIDTIKRAFKSLKNKNLIKTGNYNKLKMDRTIWYTIDYEELQKQYDEYEKSNMHQSIVAKCTNGRGQNAPSNTKEYTHRLQTENNINSFSKEKGNHSLPKTKVAVSSSGRKNNVIERVQEYCLPLYDDGTVFNIVDTFEYYFEKYYAYKGQMHPNISDDSIVNVVNALVGGVSDMEDLIYTSGNMAYRDMIDEHFRINYKKGIDYNIQHFATKGILENLYYHVLY